MKEISIILIVFSFLVLSIDASAQTILTPRGSSIAVSNPPEYYSYQDKLAWSAEVAQTYPQATELNPPSATTTYNCHSYAWNRSEGGPICWIDTPGDDTYWTDQSYIETTEQLASKISYYNDDHSARQTSILGTYVSKWGSGPLMQHARDYGPASYNMSFRKYYRLNPAINATLSPLCYNGEKVFTSNTVITGSAYLWTKDDSRLAYVSGAGTTSYRVKALNTQGNAWVRLKITTPSGEVAYTPYSYVWVGIPDNSVISAIVMQGPPSGNQLCLNSNMTIAAGHSAIAAQGITKYNWDFGNWSQYFQEYSPAPGPSQARPTFYLTYGAPTPQVIKISAQNQCGTNWNQPFQKTFYAINCFGDNSFTLSPNPATNEVMIKVNDLSLVYSNNRQENIEEPATFTEVRIFDQFGNQKQNNKYAIGTKETVINTSSLMTGTYFVQILHGTKKIWEQYTLIITK